MGKRMEEAHRLKKEAVDKLHRVQRKQGVRVDPKTITDAVDPVDSNSTATGNSTTSAAGKAESEVSRASTAMADKGGQGSDEEPVPDAAGAKGSDKGGKSSGSDDEPQF